MPYTNHPLVVNIHVKGAQWDEYIGRPSAKALKEDPSLETNHWGNPFSHKGYKGTIKVATVEAAVQAYRDWLNGDAWQHIEPTRRRNIRANITKLRGKRLGCFCAGLHICHGDVLAAAANR